MNQAVFSIMDFFPLLPEAALAVGAMALLIAGVCSGSGGRVSASIGALVVIAAMVTLFMIPRDGRGEDGLPYVSDLFSVVLKTGVLFATGLTMILSANFLEREKGRIPFEYSVIILLSAVGMLVMVSAGDLLVLYLGLELQSLSLYILAAINRDCRKSTEAGVKYFVLGALSSGIMLFGCSVIYGASGALDYSSIAKALSSGSSRPIVIFGLVFIMAAMCFKLSAAPFHMWTPDVYEGALTPVTAFFAIVPKLAAIGAFARFLNSAMIGYEHEWRQVLVAASLLSMMIGAFGAIKQENIKRLLAYSSIGHAGYALVGLAAGGSGGVAATVLYMAIYVTMGLGTFGIILSLRRKTAEADCFARDVKDLSGLSRTRPVMAFILAVMMFSMAGIPPLAGFFGKFYIFMAAVGKGMYWLAVLGVLSSAVAAFYYLRVVKIMYFDPPGKETLEAETGMHGGAIIAGAAAFNLFFFLFPGELAAIAREAASSLF